MIRTPEELRLVALSARRWRDVLTKAPVIRLSAGERADLAHVLDELQHFALNGYPDGGTR